MLTYQLPLGLVSLLSTAPAATYKQPPSTPLLFLCRWQDVFLCLTASVKAGKWERSKYVGIEVKGKILGIIGLGKVGLIVARMARGLGMTVIASDPYASPAVAASANVTLVPSLGELLPECDFLTIHTAYACFHAWYDVDC